MIILKLKLLRIWQWIKILKILRVKKIYFSGENWVKQSHVQGKNNISRHGIEREYYYFKQIIVILRTNLHFFFLLVCKSLLWYFFFHIKDCIDILIHNHRKHNVQKHWLPYQKQYSSFSGIRFTWSPIPEE